MSLLLLFLNNFIFAISHKLHSDMEQKDCKFSIGNICQEYFQVIKPNETQLASILKFKSLGAYSE